MKIIDYILVGPVWDDDGEDEKFENMVREKIKEGWQPFGSPVGFKHKTCVYRNLVIRYVQAMVKYEESGGKE